MELIKVNQAKSKNAKTEYKPNQASLSSCDKIGCQPTTSQSQNQEDDEDIGKQFAYSWSSSAITPDVNPNSSGEAASITEVSQ